MWGRVFAKNIEVHQSRAVTARPMTDEARALYMPSETVTALGVMDASNFTGSELTPMTPRCRCAAPIAPNSTSIPSTTASSSRQPGYRGPHLPPAHVTVEGRPKSALSAGAINWTVVRNEPFNGAPRVMTTVRDERARLPNPPFFGSFVHFVDARCAGPVKVAVTTPFGVRGFDLTAATDPEQCNTVGKGINGMPFNGIHYGPSIAAISSTPPRFLVAYSGRTSTDFEVINVYMVTLKSANNYAGTHQVELVARLDESASGTHLLFPNLIQPDHLAGSDLGVDTPVILRYASVSGNTVREHAIALYSGMAGPRHDLATWSLAAAYPMKNCAAGDSCFIGDYRYGSLIDKAGGALRFFMPWIGGDPAGATAGTSVQGAAFNVGP